MPADDRPGRAGVVEMDVRKQEVADVGQLEALLREPRLERRERRRGPAVEERRAVVRVDEVHADRLRPAAEVEVEEPQRTHNPIFAVAAVAFARVKWLIGLVALAVLVPVAAAQGTASSDHEGDPVPLPGS